jgi:hypothetical protein
MAAPVTASMLYDLVACPHRVTMDLYSDPGQRDEPNPFADRCRRCLAHCNGHRSACCHAPRHSRCGIRRENHPHSVGRCAAANRRASRHSERDTEVMVAQRGSAVRAFTFFPPIGEAPRTSETESPTGPVSTPYADSTGGSYGTEEKRAGTA